MHAHLWLNKGPGGPLAWARCGSLFDRCAPGRSKSDGTGRQTFPRSRGQGSRNILRMLKLRVRNARKKQNIHPALHSSVSLVSYTCDERFPGSSRSASCPAPRDRTTESEENRVQGFAHSCQGIESKFCSFYRSLNLLLCTVMPHKCS